MRRSRCWDSNETPMLIIWSENVFVARLYSSLSNEYLP